MASAPSCLDILHRVSTSFNHVRHGLVIISSSFFIIGVCLFWWDDRNYFVRYWWFYLWDSSFTLESCFVSHFVVYWFYNLVMIRKSKYNLKNVKIKYYYNKFLFLDVNFVSCKQYFITHIFKYFKLGEYGLFELITA